MARLTVYDSTNDFDLSGYANVTTRIEDGDADYYTNTDIAAATMYSTAGSSLFFGHSALLADGSYGFVADGQITGRIGDLRVADWLAGRDLADYTPDSLVARIFVGDDKLRGGAGNDVLGGQAGADSLLGREGDDVLNGGVGDDVLTGGFGTDQLTGSFGADRFVFRELHDIIGGGEVVTDFNHADGDKIDLTLFDASVKTEGQQSLIFVGEAAFGATGVAEVRVDATSAGINTLQFDVNGDGELDAVLTVTTSTLLDATDVETSAPLASVPSAAVFGEDTLALVSAHAPHFLQMELTNGVLA